MIRPDNVTHFVGGIPGASGAYAFFWLYNRLVKDPLRILYFFSWWSNIPSEQICGRLTSVSAAWWAQTPDRMEECTRLLDQNFLSWEATILVCLYFGALVALATWFFVNLCFVRPIVRAISAGATDRRPRWADTPRFSARPRSYSADSRT